MSLTAGFPRVLGALGLLFSLQLTRTAVQLPSPWLGLGYFSVWVALCLVLLLGRGQRLPALALAGMSLGQVWWPGSDGHEPQTLLAWMSLIVAATVDRPAERALLLRICVSTVYAFAALSKAQPHFLSGDQLVYLVDTRPHLEPFRALVAGPAGVGLAAAALLTEAWLAVGLWSRRTRRLTAALGVGLHATLVVTASLGWMSATLLVVLNGALLAGYYAFWHGTEPESSCACRPDPPLSAGPGG